MPRRIQRRRVKGWKMPPNCVYVGRPTKWGNPYRVGQLTNRGASMSAFEAMHAYRDHVGANEKSSIHYRLPVQELRGKNLACWCPLVDKDGNKVPCHADILLEIANG